MAATTSIVDLIFKVSDQASGPAKNIADRMGSVERTMAGVKTAAFAVGASMTAIGGGIAFAAKKALDLGTKFEDTSLSIAGAISAFNLAPNIQMAEQAAVKALANIDKMAAKLPGTTEDYVEVFKSGLPAAIAAGVTDLDKIADFTSRYTAVATVNMVDAQQAGSDLSLMLTGMAGQQVAMFRKLQPLIGKTAEEFNKMTRAARMAAIDKSLAGYSGMLERAGDTMGSKLGEAEAHLVKIARLGGQPIFDEVLRQLTIINKYLTDNEDSIIRTVKTLSERLVKAFRDLVPDVTKTLVVVRDAVKNISDAFKWLMDHAGELQFAMEAVVGVWLATSTYAGFRAIADLFVVMRDAALVIEGAALTGAGATGAAATAGGAAGLTGGQIALGVAGSVAKALTTAGALAAGAFAYTLHGTLAEGTDMKAHFAAFQEGQDAYAKFLRQESPMERFNRLLGEQAKAPKGPQVQMNFHNARFDIKQAFAEGYDPDRIAAAFVESIGSTALYPGSSTFAAAGTGA
jgi:hypothetical protein